MAGAGEEDSTLRDSDRIVADSAGQDLSDTQNRSIAKAEVQNEKLGDGLSQSLLNMHSSVTGVGGGWD